ncbi:MAG: pitrilysin family protein, partial [Candidatus Cloacimonadota bacterium]|nr:pitrilysin family protein [Candidatus Cloacimonadota bacterium]
TPKINSFNLDNNLQIIHSQSSSVPIVSIHLFVRMGSCWESTEEAGFSHFTEHLVFKSTEKFPNNNVMNQASNLGGFLNAYTEFDSTCFYLSLHSDHAEKGFEILSQLSHHSNFSDEDFVAEKKVVIEEMKQYENNPEENFIQEIPQKYFKKNPFGKPIIGNFENLETSTPDNLRKFYRDKYRPSNCFLVIAGDLSLSDAKNISNKYFGNWVDKAVSKPTTGNLDIHKKVFESNVKDIKDDFLCFILPDVSEISKQSYPMNVLMKYFGLGKGSRLYNRLCIQEKVARNVRVHSYTGIYSGILMVLVYPKNASYILKIIKIFKQELELLKNNGISNNTLEKVKKKLLVSFGYSYEFMEGLAENIGSEEISGGFHHFVDYEKNIKAITQTDIKECIQEYINFDKLSFYHLGPKKLDSKIKQEIMNSYTISKKRISGNFYQTSLKNGLKVVFKRVKNKPTIGVAITNSISQLNETEKTRGYNFLSISSLLRGTKKRNYEQLIEYSHNNGIQINVSPGMEYYSAFAKCFSEDINITLDLLAEIIYEPVFHKEEVENIRGSIAQELRKIKDYPNRLSATLWKKMMFGNKGNMHNRTGHLSSFNTISRKQASSWYFNHLNHNNMTLTIVGDFDFDNTITLIKNTFERQNFSNLKFQQNAIYQPSTKQHKIKKSGGNQAIIHIGGFACNALNKKENTAFHVLSQILSGNANSRLFEELREKHGMGYSVDFDYLSNRQVGNWVASAIVDNKVVAKAEQLIHQVFNDIKQNGIRDAELNIAKNSLKGHRIFEQESVLTQASYISTLITLGYDYEYYLNREKRIEKVNKNSVVEVAQKYFTNNNYWTHILE